MSTARNDRASRVFPQDERSVPLIQWELGEHTQCVVTAVSGAFEVYLLHDDAIVRVNRFAMPGPAFEVARSWRRDVERGWLDQGSGIRDQGSVIKY